MRRLMIAAALALLADPVRRTADGLSNLALAEREFDVALLPERLSVLYHDIADRPAGIPVAAG